jgi:orotate phosphoribosyltransferase
MLLELARVLVKTKALEFGTFSLSSGKTSSYYIDLRIVPSFPGAFSTCIECFGHLIASEIHDYRSLCGIPTSGLTYASALAYGLRKPLIYVRKEKKGHGMTKQIEGLLEPGDRVVVLDDIITTGHSILGSVELVRLQGGVVEDAAVLIDREEGGGENLSKNGIRLHKFTTVTELTDVLVDLLVLDEDEAKAIRSQIAGARV